MSATTLRLESGGRRTSGAMLTSVAFHALLLLWVAFLPRLSSESPPLTEIAWIEEPGPPGEAAPAPPAAQEIAAHPQPALRRGTVHEDPTADLSLDERIGARLTALQHAPSAPLEVVGGRSLGAASLGAPATVSGPSGSGLSPLALKHGGAGPGPALELARGGGGLRRDRRGRRDRGARGRRDGGGGPRRGRGPHGQLGVDEDQEHGGRPPRGTCEMRFDAHGEAPCRISRTHAAGSGT